tara:strand:- start:346 stop:939 length:594 start_codon:yes stop_codon:yes gene_type:complete
MLSVLKGEPNIISLQDTFYEGDYFNMIMDYYPTGDLQTSIKRKYIQLGEDNYRIFINKLVDPIYRIHKKDIVHLDIKPANYLHNYINDDYTLIDFNLAKRTKQQNYYSLNNTEVCGTSGYISPEVYRGFYSKSSDIYSLGCILLNILQPGKTVDKIDFSKKILVSEISGLNRLIIECLQPNHNDRPTIYDIKNELQN